MNDRPLDLIINQLKTYDETEVCDLLGITTEDLIRKFPERIAAKKTKLEQELEKGEIKLQKILKKYRQIQQRLEIGDTSVLLESYRSDASDGIFIC